MNAFAWLYQGLPFDIVVPTKQLGDLHQKGKKSPTMMMIIMVAGKKQVLSYENFIKGLKSFRVEIIDPAKDKETLSLLARAREDFTVTVNYIYRSRPRQGLILFRYVTYEKQG